MRLPDHARPFAWALGISAGFLAFVTWDQSYWWRNNEDYGFGWLTPVFVVYVVHQRWPQIAALVIQMEPRCAHRGGLEKHDAVRTPRPQHKRAGWARIVGVSIAAVSLAWGVLWFLLGAFYRASAGPSNPGTLAITMGAVCTSVGLLYWSVDSAAQPEAAHLKSRDADMPKTRNQTDQISDSRISRNVASDRHGVSTFPAEPTDISASRLGISVFARRWRVIALFTFPLLIWFVSAPLVSVAESALTRALLHVVISAVRGIFDLLELPISQRGNVLVLPRGEIGVAEACSGIRSLTGCIFAGSFLAATSVAGMGRKVAFIGLSFVLAIVTNLGRALFLTSWAYTHGSAAIEGTLHDATGYAVLGVTVVLLFAATTFFKPRREAPAR